MTVAIANHAGFKLGADRVRLALFEGTKNPRLIHWISTAQACFDAAQKALTKAHPPIT